MTTTQTHKSVALITGASMGLGAEFARQYAARGTHVLLVARSADKLESVAQECRSAGVQAAWYSTDLMAPGEVEKIATWAAENSEGLTPTILVNNAGFGDAGPFESMSPERVGDMVRLNVLALTELTARILPLLKVAPRGTARIIQVSSVAGYQPLPYFGVYAATKAYVTHFGEALAEELAEDGIGVTVLCPGVTKTEFGNNGKGLATEFFVQGDSAVTVVQQAIRASDQRQVLCNTAHSVRIALSRLTPRWLVRKVAGWMARRLLTKV